MYSYFAIKCCEIGKKCLQKQLKADSSSRDENEVRRGVIIL